MKRESKSFQKKVILEEYMEHIRLREALTKKEKSSTDQASLSKQIKLIRWNEPVRKEYFHPEQGQTKRPMNERTRD